MDNNDVTYEMVIERIDMMLEEMSKFRRAVIAVHEGMPFTEAFSDQVYLEDADRKNTASSNLAWMMQHLLKIKYSTTGLYRDGWKDEIRNKFRRHVIDDTRWGSKKPYRTVINYLQNNLQDIYEDAIRYYKIAAKDYKDLVPGIKFIPEECPWDSLESLIEDPINELLSGLPNPDYD